MFLNPWLLTDFYKLTHSTNNANITFHVNEKTYGSGIHSRNVNRKFLAEIALWKAKMLVRDKEI